MLKSVLKNRSNTTRQANAIRKTQLSPSATSTAPSTGSNKFSADHRNPFHQEHNNQRWLLTTCLAGLAGSMVIAGAVLGVFGETESGGQALASVQPSQLWQRPSVTTKGDLNTDDKEAIELRPYRVSSVAYRRDEAGSGASSLALLPQRTSSINGDNLYPTIEQASLGYPISGALHNEPKVIEGSFHTTPGLLTNTTTIAKTLPPEPVDKVFRLKNGETLIDKLAGLGVSPNTAQLLTNALEPVFPTKLLKAGQKFTVTLDNQQDFYGNYVLYPVQLSFSPGSREEISVEADDEGQFIARVEGNKAGERSQYAKKKTKPATQFRVSSKISSTLYASARDRNVPKNVISQMIRAFSYGVDFQRNVKRGDSFELFYGVPLSGTSKKRKVMHYAKLNYGGKSKTYYRFTTASGKTGYYDKNGRSANRSLMSTPISGARISSGFGLRRHPILGYTKMHTGIDFAAPRGTPIHAAGGGITIHVGRKGGYGRAVMIKHGNGYITLYAHMRGYAKGLRKGQRVRQGQVIGYVGTSGRSTGPHLHYEVRLNNKPINPKRVRSSGHIRLTSKDLARFKKRVKKIATLMKKTPRNVRVAKASK